MQRVPKTVQIKWREQSCLGTRVTDPLVERTQGTLALNKMSKPLMEKKRRARINNSLEQLKILLEKHYSYNERKRKLEKADILELTVKHIQNLLSMRQEGMAPVDQEGIIQYKEGFKDCLNKLSVYIIRSKTSQEKLGLMLVDQLNALQHQAYGRIQNVQVPASPRLPEKSDVLYPSHHLMENNMRNLETGNSERKPSRGNTTFGEEPVITKENGKSQQVSTQNIHVTNSPSCMNNLHPFQQPSNVWWRPW